MIGSSPITEEDVEDSMEAPLLDVQLGNGRPSREITVSFWQFFILSEWTEPVTRAVLKRYFLRIFATSSLLSLAYYNVIFLDAESFRCALFFFFPPFFLAFVVLRDQRYYNRHGAIRYAAFLEQRYQRLRCLTGVPGGVVNLNLGNYHEVRGEYDQAIKCYQQFLDDVSFLKETAGGAALLKKLGGLYYAQGRYEEALEHLLKAIQLRRLKDLKPRPLEKKRLYHSLGKTYKALGRHAEALECYQKAVQIMRDGGYGRNIDVAVSLTKVGEMHEAIGGEASNDAVNSYREALEIHILNEGEFPRTVAVAKLHERLGDFCYKSTKTKEDGDGETANGHWNIALEVYRRKGKTDEDIEIIRLQSKIREAFGVV